MVKNSGSPWLRAQTRHLLFGRWWASDFILLSLGFFIWKIEWKRLMGKWCLDPNGEGILVSPLLRGLDGCVLRGWEGPQAQRRTEVP
jgi:hypothetical protein